MNITMTPDEEINKQTWWLLQELQKERLLTGNKIKFSLRASTDNSIPNTDTQLKLLNKLAGWSDSPTAFGACISLGLVTEWEYYLIEIIPHNFDTKYKIYESENIKMEEGQIKDKKINLKKGQEITQLELLKDEGEIKKITVYINVEYNSPKFYNRRKNWGKMYELAKEKQVSYNKGFFDYFNSNLSNPLYAKEGFKVTKILKQESNLIIPNIKINLITQKKVSQRLNSA